MSSTFLKYIELEEKLIRIRELNYFKESEEEEDKLLDEMDKVWD